MTAIESFNQPTQIRLATFSEFTKEKVDRDFDTYFRSQRGFDCSPQCLPDDILLSYGHLTWGVYADLVTVAGFKPVVAAEKSPGGFDSLPLPFLFSRESSGRGEMRCFFVGSRGCYFESLAMVANSSRIAMIQAATLFPLQRTLWRCVGYRNVIP